MTENASTDPREPGAAPRPGSPPPPAASVGRGDSLGVVRPRRFSCDEPLTLASGQTLPSWELVYETYGTLNTDRSNAVLVCHALSGNHHAAGVHHVDDRKPGWWDVCIGPGKPIDTNRFYVVCPNNLGGCDGSTGPRSTNPATGRPWGPDFPVVTVPDWVHTQARLADHLGIGAWAAVVGGSLGGMQAMQWAIDLPDRLRHAVLIASAPRLSAQNIAFNEIARHAIMSDPAFLSGRYQEQEQIPVNGLRLARMVGHVTYQSDDGLRDKFGREIRHGDVALGRDVQFQVESYLHHQGKSFSRRFDANTYILMTRALDYFDPARAHGDDLTAAFRRARCGFTVMSFTTDWRFAPSRSREIVQALVRAGRPVSYAEIEAAQGHDAFLLPVPRYLRTLDACMQRIARDVGAEIQP